MNFVDFQLRAWVASDEQLQVLVHSSPVGAMRQPLKVPFLKHEGVDLNLDLEIVGGTNKESKIVNLIEYLERRDLLEYLVTAAQQQRRHLRI